MTVRLQADGQGQVSPAALTFGSANWNTAQRVQVTAVYEVRLNSKPASPATVALNDGDQLNANPAGLRFTPQNWQVAQTVTVAMAGKSATVATVRHSVASSDPLYENAPAASVRVGPFSGGIFLPVIRRQ